MDNFYTLLKVHPAADPETIRRAFYRLAKRYHPDVSRDSGGFLKILDAYKILIDNSKRIAYDRYLGLNGHGANTDPRNQSPRDRRAPGERTETSGGASGRRVLPKDRVSYALSLRDIVHHPKRRTHRRRGGFVNPKGYDVCVGVYGTELRDGAMFLVDIPAHVICPVCRGNRVSCTLCSDRGYVLRAVPVPVSIPRNLVSGSVFVVSLREIRLTEYAFFRMKELRVMVRFIDEKAGSRR
jgi:DnaJ-class molecular chaperone